MAFPFASLHVRLGAEPLPDWGEYAPFLWGEGVNYDSDGDAYDPERPAYWTILDVRNRQTDERLLIRPFPVERPEIYRDSEGQLRLTPSRTPEQVAVLLIEGDEVQSVCLAAYLTAFRTLGTVFDPAASREVPSEEIIAFFSDIDERVAIANRIRDF